MNRRLKKYQIHRPQTSEGFTLMEIVVATAIFALLAMALLSMFDYALKINRRSEALRQASQGMRNFMEQLVKEVRNGRIDYYVSGGQALDPKISASSPCSAPNILGNDTYNPKDNKLGIIDVDNVRYCFYLADEFGNYTPNVFVPLPGRQLKLYMEKDGNIKETLNPPNFYINQMYFLIRPVVDPFTKISGAGGNPDYVEIQPVIGIVAEFRVVLPTGETVPIYYQTSISTDKYDLPNS